MACRLVAMQNGSDEEWAVFDVVAESWGRAHTGAVDVLARALLVVAAVIVGSLCLMWALQRSLIYAPATQPVGPAGAAIEGAQDVRLHTSDGLNLGAWYLPARDPHRGVTVLVANGNGGDRSLRASLAEALRQQGLGVLLFDYRGYGGNPGRPSEEGLARDARAAHRYLTGPARVPADRLVYLGESLGAAVLTELAVDHPPAALVLRSPFVDLASVGQVHYPFVPVRALLRDRYPLTGHLSRVRVPVTVVYGTDDHIVPPSQSRAVARSAPFLWQLVEVEGAGHNDPSLVSGPGLTRAVASAAERLDQAG